MSVIGDIIGYIGDYLDEDATFGWAEGATKGEAKIDKYALGRCADALYGQDCLRVEPLVGGIKIIFTEED